MLVKKADCFDSFLHKVVLNIADFLLDFAVLGFERSANVPSFLHPSVSNMVMQKLGIPHICNTEDELSVFLFPTNINGNIKNTKEKKDKVIISVPIPNHTVIPSSTVTTAPMSDTAYFFFRWIWIYFPLIALGNINSLKRVTLYHPKGDEIEKLDENIENVCDKNNVQDTEAQENIQKDQSVLLKNNDLSWCCIENSYDKPGKKKISSAKVPLQKVTMKKTFRQETSMSSKILMDTSDYEIQKENMIRLLSKVKNEYDNMVQTRKKLLKQKKDIGKEYDKSYNSVKNSNTLLSRHKAKLIQQRLENKKNNYLQEEALNKKYCEILKYCQENPANDRGLVRKLESKVSIDSEQILKFEEILHKTNGEIVKMSRSCQSIKKTLFKTKDLHHKLIENRLHQRWNLERASNPHPNNKEITMGTSSVASVDTLNSSPEDVKSSLEAKSRSNHSKSTNVIREEKYQVMEDQIRNKTSDRILSLKQFQSRILDQEQTQDMINIKKTIDERMMALRAGLQGKKRELDRILFENDNHQTCNAKKINLNENLSAKKVSILCKKDTLKLQKSAEITENALGATRCNLENVVGKIKRVSLTSNISILRPLAFTFIS